MAGVIRVGIVRVLGRQQSSFLSAQNTIPTTFAARNISGKSMKGNAPRPVKPKPWPYQEKKYGIFQALYEKTSKRIDENSKLIVVEGPIAVGKSKFAKELADELEMLYVPQADMDLIYINSYSYDMRKLDPQMPESCRSYDNTNFCCDPKHPLAAQYQLRMYYLRYSQYIDALAHILNTGQGVVMNRCVYSDFVFLETMFKNNYISKGARSFYYDVRHNTIGELLKPHLVIYLDCPVNVVKENIKKRNLPHEVVTELFTDKYLEDMETIYKQQYLKDISVHADLMVYDWSTGGDTEVVVEDIERIDFNKFEEDFYNKKMKDWRFPLEWDWCEARIKYSNEKYRLMNYFNIPRFDVPELLRTPEDSEKWREIWLNAPGMKYCKGYNSDMGDTGIITKTKMNLRNSE